MVFIMSDSKALLNGHHAVYLVVGYIAAFFTVMIIYEALTALKRSQELGDSTISDD
jgi:ABC-type spermidine/putrescine transport system permease subunit I